MTDRPYTRPETPRDLAYHYESQAWVRWHPASGRWRVARCGHLSHTAGCYACEHVGEAVSAPEVK